MTNLITVTVKDENFSGKVLQEVRVGFKSETVTIKEIIEARVRQEVENYNNKLPEYYNGLIQPRDAENTINGFKLRSKKPIDTEKQVYVALDAFQKNGFFVLVDTQQSTSLDQTIHLLKDTRISFVKLTPLVGG
jgi:glutaredoxin 2